MVDGEPALVAALGRLDELDRAACRTAVETRFSARRMVDDHVALYRRCSRPVVDLAHRSGSAVGAGR